jgi:hypothetical protein
MKMSNMSLVEEAWNLLVNISNTIEFERIKNGIGYTPVSDRKKRLKRLKALCYDRYLRRLKKLWS